MRRHRHTGRRGGRGHRAVLAGALLTFLVGRRRHHRWHRPHPGRRRLVGGSFEPSRHRTRRHQLSLARR
jgi:hypothetical protein